MTQTGTDGSAPAASAPHDAPRDRTLPDLSGSSGRAPSHAGTPCAPRPVFRQPAFFLALAFVAGILASRHFALGGGAALVLLGACVAASLAALVFRRALLSQALLLASAASLGAWCHALDVTLPADSAARLFTRGGPLEEGGIHPFGGRVLEREPASRPGSVSRYRLRLEWLETRAGRVGVSGVAFLDAASPDLPYGAAVEGVGRFRLPAGAANPGQFDYREYLLRRGIACIISAPDERLVRVMPPRSDGQTAFLGAAPRGLAASAACAVGGAFESARAVLSARLSSLGLARSGVIPATVLGERSAVGTDVEDAFVRSGTMHLLAISGLHLGIVGGFLWWLLRCLGAPLRPASAVTLALAILYAVLVGARPPVVRAALMLSLFCVAVILNRRALPLSVISTAVLAMLVVGPQSLFEPGFQLSVVAVLGIFYVGAPLGAAMSARAARLKPPLPRALCAGARVLGVSLGAWIAVAPLALYHFQVASFVSPLSNLLLIPATWVMLVSSAAAVLLSFISAAAAAPMALAASGAEWALFQVARLLGALPGAYAYLPAPPAEAIFGMYAFLAAGALLRAIGRPVMPVALAGLAAANALLFASLFLSADRPPEVATIRAGRASAVLLVDSNRRAALFLGKGVDSWAAANVICPSLLARGIARIDLLVESAGADARVRDVLEARLGVERVLRQRRFRGSPGQQPDSAPEEAFPAAPGEEHVVEFGPGDMVEGPGDWSAILHCGLPQDFLNPSDSYFTGVVAEVVLSRRRVVVLLDISDGCAVVAGRRVTTRPDVVLHAGVAGAATVSGAATLELIKRLAPLTSAGFDDQDEAFPAAVSIILGDIPEIRRFSQGAQGF